MSAPRVAAVIAAAGASRRLGRPKQLLVRAGRPLVRATAERLLAAGFAPVIVVLGFEADAVAAVLDDLAVERVRHAGWQTGMGGSLAAGVARLDELAIGPAGVLLMPCDLPEVDVGALRELLDTFARDPGRPVAALYEGIVGTPAIFPATLRAELARLSGDRGARRLLRGRRDVVAVPMPSAARDVDDPGSLPPTPR